MKLLILGIVLTMSQIAFSSEIVSVFGYEQFEGKQFTQPNSAVILYADGSFELLRKYTSEVNTSVQSGKYIKSDGQITLEVKDSTCQLEIDKGALGSFTLNHTDQRIFLEGLVSYDKKDAQFLELFSSKEGCLFEQDK